MLAAIRRLLRRKVVAPGRKGGGGIAAAEFIKQTEGDPEYQARLAVMEQQRAEIRHRCEEDERELVGEIRALGLNITSVYDLVNNTPHSVLEHHFVGPYAEAYPVLLKHLTITHEPNIREGIIRALIVKDLPEHGTEILLQQLRQESNQIHRCCLAMACRKALGRKRASAYPEIDSAFRAGMV